MPSRSVRCFATAPQARSLGLDEDILYDRDGPLPMAHLQRSFVTDEADNIIVKRLFPLHEMAEGIPSLLGLCGTVPSKHRGEYKPAALSLSSVAYIRDRYAEDYALIEEMSGA